MNETLIKRRLPLLLGMMIFLFSLSLQALTIYAPKAPPTIPLLRAAQTEPSLKIIFYNDVQSEVLPKILKGNDNLYILPANMAAKLYNKGENVRLIGVLSLGLLYVVSSDPGIQTLKDVDNKKISIGEPGSSPDVISRFIFSRMKIKPLIVYSSSQEIARFFIGGKIRTAVLPEPLASMVLAANTNARRVASYRNIWQTLETNSAGIPQTVLVGKEEFILKNRKEINRILNAYRDAVSWCNVLPGDAAVLGKNKLGIPMTLTALKDSIPFMNLTFLSGKEAEPDLLIYFRNLKDSDSQSIGEKLPDEKFFME